MDTPSIYQSPVIPPQGTVSIQEPQPIYVPRTPDFVIQPVSSRVRTDQYNHHSIWQYNYGNMFYSFV